MFDLKYAMQKWKEGVLMDYAYIAFSFTTLFCPGFEGVIATAKAEI
jgi:hypothetical protein